MTNAKRDSTAEVALWATQGGGYAVETLRGRMVWHELPDWMRSLPAGDPDKAKLGDPVPDEWDIQPANQAAMDAALNDIGY